VIRTGVGGDEWIGSGLRRDYYLEELASGRLDELARCWSRDRRDFGPGHASWWLLQSGVLPMLPAFVRNPLRWVRRKVAPPTVPDPRVSNEEWLSAELRQALAHRRESGSVAYKAPRRRSSQTIQSLLVEDPRITLGIELEERIAASIGLELRHPMLDPRLLQFAVETPARMRAGGGSINKRMHRIAMADLLPRAILDRRTKAGFSIVFRRHLEHLYDELAVALPAARPGWVRQPELHAVYDFYFESISSGTSSGGEKAQWLLWNLMCCSFLADSRQPADIC
jgi:asparagine synthase (glutamine-hydrolysing)